VLADMTDMVRQGDLVFAFGSPFDFKFSMSSGIVSGKGRSVEALGQGGYENFIQVDAAINPGNSGGPLTDFRGRVIGMNTAIATGRRSSLEEGQFAGIGLAIPLTMIEPVVTQIIETGVVEKGWLGVEVQEVNRTTTARFGFSGEGVRISVVQPESPAEHAGIRVNDIVTSVDGTPVASVPQLRSTISSILPGETTVLSIWRPALADGAYEELSIPVRLARLDRLREFGELPQNQSLDRIVEVGIAKMSTSTPALAAGMGIEHRPGVIIERVVADTGIALGIEEGMTITEVKGVPVRSTDDFIGQLRRFDLRNPLPVSAFGRDGSYGTTYLIVVR
jgi:serine protease Do